MITHLHSEGFKGLSGLSFVFRPLTVLTGTNCSGKSSLIQSILLSRLASLSFSKGSDPVYVPLNGPPYDLNLGTAFDILPFGTEQIRDVHVTLQNGPGEFRWEFAVENDTDRYLVCRRTPSAPFPGLTATHPGGFTYLSAMREGQPDLLSLPSVPKSELTIDCFGKSAAGVLHLCGNHSVYPGLHHPMAGQLPLLKQVEHWMREFVPHLSLRVESSSTLAAVGLRYLQGGIFGEWMRPTNTGFGLSYCLPIVVAGLLAKPGSLLIVDSPEAHLHPAAQSAMGQFLARLAAHGIQVILETHSDHILNGIRLAALRVEHPLQPTAVQFHFLTLGAEGKVRHYPIEITPLGGLSDYPKQFFDQSELDLRGIVDARKKAR